MSATPADDSVDATAGHTVISPGGGLAGDEGATALPGVNWLTASEQLSWRNFLESMHLLLEQLDRELRAGKGLTLSEYEVMVRLSEQPQLSMRMARLAAEIAMSRSRLTHIVSRMEKRGLLRRSSDATDGRGIVCSLTPEGMRVLEDAAPLHVGGVRTHLVDKLSEEELATLGQAFLRVNLGMREHMGLPGRVPDTSEEQDTP